MSLKALQYEQPPLHYFRRYTPKNRSLVNHVGFYCESLLTSKAFPLYADTNDPVVHFGRCVHDHRSTPIASTISVDAGQDT